MDALKAAAAELEGLEGAAGVTAVPVALIAIGKNTPIATITTFDISPSPKIKRMNGRIALLGIG